MRAARASKANIAAQIFVLRNAWCISGVERLQLALERERVRRRQGPADNPEQAVEAGRPHVQQVKAIFGVRASLHTLLSDTSSASNFRSRVCNQGRRKGQNSSSAAHVLVNLHLNFGDLIYVWVEFHCSWDTRALSRVMTT